MEDDEAKHGYWFQKGTYMNRMLHCGDLYNGVVQHALEYLPVEVLDKYKSALAFISTGGSDGCRVAPGLCKNREIIVLSELIVPPERDGRIRSGVPLLCFCRPS